VPGGLEIRFPDGSHALVTPGWWANQGKWYLNLEIAPTQSADGIAGPIAGHSWLPKLPDGSSMGAMPASVSERFVDLYEKFGEAWRVTSASSLFDYGPGTSTGHLHHEELAAEESTVRSSGDDARGTRQRSGRPVSRFRSTWTKCLG